jgi:steroid 5-alpha reductase family enzyme
MVEETIGLFASVGLSIGPATAIYAICAAYVFIAVTVIWLIGLAQGNHSMMDGYYGWAYASIAWIAYFLSGPVSTSAAIILLAVSLHGARLGSYLSRRWWGHRKTTGGDKRYFGFKESLSPGYWWKSFFVVMQAQTVVIMVISLPTVYGIATNTDHVAPLNWLAVIGMIVFGVGSYYEWLGDGQLEAFKADPANKGRYQEYGVWAQSRHPHYFGNTCVWWGVYLVAVSANSGIWWTIAGPIFNTIMLTKILGVAFQDKFMGDRPAYQDLMKRKSAFIPRFW